MRVADADRRRRWAATHGALRGALRRRAREGSADPDAVPDPAADSGPTWDRLRGDRPFAPGAAPGVLVTVHHDVARELLASEAFGMPTPPAGPPGPLRAPSLITLDGAEHAHHRARLARAFNPRAVAGWAPHCAAVADELLDALPGTASPDGTVDVVAGFAHPLPLRLITTILGLPANGAELPAELPRWGDAVVAALDTGLSWERFVEVEDDLEALAAWLDDEVAALRVRGGDGLLARLAAEGDAEDDHLVVAALFLLAAGFETTTHVVSAGVEVLAAHPDRAARLRAEPDRWPAAVEELLRLASPVTRAVRRAHRDVEVAGEVVPAGTVVEVRIAAADHDPAVFTDPWTFDPDSPRSRGHLAFGHGPHHCLGAGLARLEAAVALRALTERFPDLAAAGSGTWRPTTLVQGRATLPVRLGAGAGAVSGAARRCAW